MLTIRPSKTGNFNNLTSTQKSHDPSITENQGIILQPSVNCHHDLLLNPSSCSTVLCIHSVFTCKLLLEIEEVQVVYVYVCVCVCMYDKEGEAKGFSDSAVFLTSESKTEKHFTALLPFSHLSTLLSSPFLASCILTAVVSRREPSASAGHNLH